MSENLRFVPRCHEGPRRVWLSLALACSFALAPSSSPGFEGHIRATLIRGGETQTWLYTVGTNCLRIERGETNWPHAMNLIALDSGVVTLVFPDNRSFVRLKDAAAPAPASIPADVWLGGVGRDAPRPGPGAGALAGPAILPGPPPLTGPTGVASGPFTPAPPTPMVSALPTDMTDPLEFKATGQKTNLLGYACERFELRQRGQLMEVWATDKLLPFAPWLANPPPRFGLGMIEEQWPQVLKARKLFPLLAILKFEQGPDRLRFEVQAIQPEKVVDAEGKLFQPPPDYREIQPPLF